MNSILSGILFIIIFTISTCKTIDNKSSISTVESAENDSPPPCLAVPSIISNSMMIQQNKPIRIWGRAPLSSNIKVKIIRYSDDKTVVEGQAISSGRSGDWLVTLPELRGGFTTYRIEISDQTKKITIDDVLVGEVWMNGGQSNMELQVRYTVEASTLMSEAKYPYIRLFIEDHISKAMYDNVSPRPLWNVSNGYWRTAKDGDGISNSSAIGYSFARYLYLYLKDKGKEVPVGMMSTATGSTSIAAWIGRKTLESDPELMALLPPAWQYKATQQMPDPYFQPTACYNHKIAPLQNLNIRGIIWAQGEANAGPEKTANLYKKQLLALMGQWREDFRDVNMPFLIAELPPYAISCETPEILDQYAFIREAQFDASEKEKFSYALPVYDIDRSWDFGKFAYTHPVHTLIKRPIGERLAAAALQMAYGFPMEYSGPKFKSLTFRSGKAVVLFSNVAAGLKIKNGDRVLSGFAIAGRDRNFTKANALISAPDSVTVFSPDVPEPVAVTYAFTAMNQSANLMNSLNLPTQPFRSDRIKSNYLRIRPTFI
ncbi:MAG: hypothetical protein HQK54_15470, partial [Oligoflexales bacterium]|nr:hypothetical protein [Oligoflexales bacterium]